MSDNNASLKAVSRHLPLLRAPLIINNFIALVLAGLCVNGNAIFPVELAFVSISFLVGLFDIARYYYRKSRSSSRTASTAATNGGGDGDGDFHGSVFVMTVDAFLSLALLPVWIVGLVVSSEKSWYYDSTIAMIATFGAFISWSFHLTSFCVEAYIWIKLGWHRRSRAMRRCSNCDHDLGTSNITVLFGNYYAPTKATTDQQSQRRLDDDENEHGREEQQTTALMPPAARGTGSGVDRLVVGGGGGGSSANEYDEGETDRLILEDDERKS